MHSLWAAVKTVPSSYGPLRTLRKHCTHCRVMKMKYVIPYTSTLYFVFIQVILFWIFEYHSDIIHSFFWLLSFYRIILFKAISFGHTFLWWCTLTNFISFFVLLFPIYIISISLLLFFFFLLRFFLFLCVFFSTFFSMCFLDLYGRLESQRLSGSLWKQR